MEQLTPQLKMQLVRLQQQLSPLARFACQRAAWQVRQRLPAIMRRADWEAQLIREIEQEFTVQGASPAFRGRAIAAILMVIAAILILIGTMLGKATGENAGGKDSAKEKVDLELAKLAAKLLARLERQGNLSLQSANRP